MARVSNALQLSAIHIASALLLTLCLLPVARAQDASARKNFVKRLAESTVLKKSGSQIVPAYNLSVSGPDSTFFVYHALLMNRSLCRSMLTEGFVTKFHALGFTKLICTDDADASFAFDPIVQTVSPVELRKDYVEMIRRSVIKQLGPRTPAGYNLSIEGAEGTTYVHHQSAVSLADCNRLLVDRFVSSLRRNGFVRMVCTDDRAMTFVFDMNSQPSVTAFALLENPK